MPAINGIVDQGDWYLVYEDNGAIFAPIFSYVHVTNKPNLYDETSKEVKLYTTVIVNATTGEEVERQLVLKDVVLSAPQPCSTVSNEAFISDGYTLVDNPALLMTKDLLDEDGKVVCQMTLDPRVNLYKLKLKTSET